MTEEYQRLKAEAGEQGLDWHDLREEQQRQRRLTRVAATAQLLATQGQQVRGGGWAVSGGRFQDSGQ